MVVLQPLYILGNVGNGEIQSHGMSVVLRLCYKYNK